MADNLNHIQKFITCSSCSQYTIDSFSIASCCHTFCENCIRPKCNFGRAASGVHQCPKCGSSYTEDMITPNYLNNSIAEKFIMAKQKSMERICMQCRKGNVLHICLHCPGYLCTECHDKHSIIPVCKSHKVVPLPEDDMDSSRIVPAPCLEHSKQMITMNCSDCNKAICDQCLSQNHAGHRTESIDSALQVYRMQVNGVMNGSSNNVKLVSDLMNYLNIDAVEIISVTAWIGFVMEKADGAGLLVELQSGLLQKLQDFPKNIEVDGIYRRTATSLYSLSLANKVKTIELGDDLQYRMCILHDKLWMPSHGKGIKLYSFEGDLLETLQPQDVVHPSSLFPCNRGHKLFMAAKSGLYVTDVSTDHVEWIQLKKGNFNDVYVDDKHLAALEENEQKVFIWKCKDPFRIIASFTVTFSTDLWATLCIMSQNVYVCDSYKGEINVYSLQGRHMASYGCQGETVPGKLYHPYLNVMDNKGNILVADKNNGRFQLLSYLGKWSVLENLKISCPIDLLIKEDKLFILHDDCGRKISIYQI